MSIGENIRRIRIEKKMTQKELGDKLGGISQQQIGRWETDKANPKIGTLKHIADTLQVELWEIVELDQMDLETRMQQIKKMIAQLSPEGLKEFDRLVTESLNENQEPYQKEPEKAARNAPKFYTRDENGNIITDGKPPIFTDVSWSFEEAQARNKAHSIFDSILDRETFGRKREEIAGQIQDMLTSYNRLNDAGRKEAVKRVDELTELPRYTQPTEPPQE